MRPKRHVTAALLLLAAAPARAGLVLTLESPGRTSKVEIEGNKARFEETGPGGTILTIFDGDAGKYVTAMPSERAYAETTEADLKELAARARSRGLPAEGTPAGGAPPAVRFQPTGRGETVAGFRCEGYRELVEGKVHAEGCYIPWSAAAVRREDLAPFVKMGAFLEALGGAAGMGPGEASSAIERQVAGAPGFPAVHAEVDDDGERGPEERLVRLDRAAVAPERFRVPAGWTRARNRF